MKLFNYAVAVAAACIATVSPLRAETVAANAIEAVNVAQQGNEIAVKIDLREALTSPPAGFAVANPAKIAFDFPATGNALGKTTQVLNEGDLRSLNVVQVAGRTRLVLNLVRNMNYRTRVDGKALYVTLSPIERLSDAVAERSVRFAEESLVGSKHVVRDVMFRRGKDGEGRVVVDLSDAGTGIDIRKQGPNLIVDFMRTSVPEHLRRKLDVTDFATPVLGVETRSLGENVRMVISPTGLWEHNAYQTDNQFVVEVKKIVEDPNKLVQGTKTGYQGPRVSINYQNGDVRALLRLMAEELGLNAVINETVSGTITLVLKDVPADQVIDIIFQQKNLDMRKNGNILLIAPRDELMLNAKLQAEAQQAFDLVEPVTLEVYQINYQKAAAVKALLIGESRVVEKENITGSVSKMNLDGERTSLLSSRGSATADEISNKLFVYETASRHQEIAKFIKMVDLAPRQVLLEARIVEASDDFNRSIGAKLGLINSKAVSVGNGINFSGGSGTPGTRTSSTKDGVTTTTSTPGSVTQTPMVGVNLPSFESTGGTLAFSLFNSSLTRILNMEIAALQADGLGKLISSPRVVTANNVEATIEDGTEIPYQTITGTGDNRTVTVSFKPAKLVLVATPQITPEGTVKMELMIKKEEADWTRAILGNPPIKSSIVKTNVVVENGGTVVVGGVYITNQQSSVEKVPLLGDIPFFGWMFKFKNDFGNRRELLIFITPRIISEKLRLE